MTTPQADAEFSGYPLAATPTAPAARRGFAWLAIASTLVLATLHGAAVWMALGGREGMNGEWPPLQADHGIHFHHGLVTRHFLATTGTTAGYDPSFMAGYAMSIVSDLSSTLSDLVMAAFGPDRAAFAYKLHVLGCAALVPWLVAAAGVAWRARPAAVALAVALTLIYFWTGFPCVYAELGMLNYLLSVPLGLLTVAALTAYLDRGGLGRWLGAVAVCSAVFLVHVTSPMLVAPAGLLAYGVAVARARRDGRPFPASRHLGLGAMVPAILAANAFWWVPGYWLASTKGGSEFAFAHPEPVVGRLAEIVWSDVPIEVVVVGLGLVGLAALARRDVVAASGLGGFLAAGFGWGYLAGFSRALDTLQPGRHTYAFYTAACIAAGVGLDEILARLRSGRLGRLDRWAAVGLVLIGVRVFGPSLAQSFRKRLGGPEPFLSSRATPRLLWLVDRVGRHVKPGERLLYEETGQGVPGLTDPFQGRHYSPVLPRATGVEVLGGPYLHATVTTNFTQFGEGKLFGDAEWGRDQFVRYAKLYRPAAIVCWSPRARAFCLANPDLVRILEDDGTLIVGRVLGFEGATVRGSAEVEAGPGRIEVKDMAAAEDGLVVLRYHAVPHLRPTPTIPWEPVFLEADPVPFIGLRPVDGPVAFELRLSPWSRPDP